MDKDIVLTYRGRSATQSDIEFINGLIKNNPNASRRALSQILCREWNWVQANGSLRDMIARGFMLELHRNGHIDLPVRKHNPPNPFLNRKKPEQLEIDQTPVTMTLKEISPLDIKLVKNTSYEPLFNSLIEHHHYLGYCHPVYYLETFVDTELFAGTCYKAANWNYLGDTTGRGKQENRHIKTRSIKAVWGYPLIRDFRQLMTRLSDGSAEPDRRRA